MITSTELRNLTMELTKRPELGPLTDAAVRTAVLRAHHIDFFPRDLAEHNFAYFISLHCPYQDFPDISVALPRLRTLKNVYALDRCGCKTEELDYRDSDDLYDADGTIKRFNYTLIGDTLRCYFGCNTGVVQIYYYQNPVVTSTGFNSWIADTYPDDIAGWAAAIVMARTGFLELANQYQTSYVKPLREQLLASHLFATA